METTENKMTIHRGLAELKLIDSKIEKRIEQLRVLSVQHGDKDIEGRYKKEEWDNLVKGAYNSLNDLIERKMKIKSAIVRVNAETMIEIGGKKMTIADAITRKNIVNIKKHLWAKINAERTATMATVNRNNETMEANVKQLLEVALGKDNVKVGSDEVKSIRDPYVKVNEVKMVDALGVDKLLEDLSKEIEDFELEIDFTLSNINAVTFFEI